MYMSSTCIVIAWTEIDVILKTFFNSFGWNLVRDEGASALADGLRVNRSLRELRYVSTKITFK